MKLKLKLIVLASLASLALPASAGLVLAGWDFNTDDGSVATGTLSPSEGAGSLALVGGATNFFSSGSGSSDPALFPLNSAWSVGGFPAQGTASDTVGFVGKVSIVGYSQAKLSFDFRNQPSANKWYSLDVSGDGGATWDALDTFSVDETDVWSTFVSDLLPAVSDPANFAFRLTAIFAPGTTEYEATDAGYNGDFSLQLDRLQITAATVPEPTSWALVGAALLGMSLSRPRSRVR